MSRIPLAIVLLLTSAVATAALAPQTQKPLTAMTPAARTTAAASPASDLSRDAIDGAVAGVLVGALTEQFGGRSVSIKLGKINVLPSSIRDRIVSGEGSVRIGTDEDWIGFRFNTLYDTSVGNAAYPAITLGGVASGEREIPNDTTLVRQLDDNIVSRIGKEFASQTVRLQFDTITTVEAGTRYLRINASGIADFGRDGTTPAQIEGLYDRRDNTWLRLNYELGQAPGIANSGTVGTLAGN
ncbi:MAG: hypothetical protein ACOH1R_05395 [Luteimonas sp.]